jgi:hypothetical protein
MNRHARRAAAAQERKPRDAAAIRQAFHYLAHVAAPTATGATLFLPDGSTLYLSADDARALYSEPKGEVAQ